MTKKLKALAAGVLTSLALAACTSGTTQSAPEQPADACQPTNPCTISFRWWGGEERQQRQLAAIELFESQNPGIQVQPLPVSFDGYYDTLGVEMTARNAPDVFTLDRSWPLEYGSRGGLMDLAQIPTVDLSAFPETALAPSTIDGEVFGVPNGSNATGLIVNADLFTEAGIPLPDENTWTWDDFARIAAEITANTPDGVFGAELRPWDFINAYATQRDGVGLFTADGQIGVSDATLADFYTMMNTLTETGGAPTAAQTSELLGAGPAETLMGRGMSAMLFAPSNQIGAYTAAANADLRCYGCRAKPSSPQPAPRFCRLNSLPSRPAPTTRKPPENW